jgi:tRNA A37 threonylcarbamoyladenosine dehydratase
MAAAQGDVHHLPPGAGPLDEADDERRFGGLRRLHGEQAYTKLRGARLAVVGVGGVGSWAVEALARCGVASLTLIDLDHVAESNINRQVQALGATVGMAKVQALRTRIADIHPGCVVHGVEDFVEPGNWPALLPQPVDGLIDACDQSRAKLALADWALRERVPFVSVGAAGGKLLPHLVEVEDLAETTHDPLLAGLRQRLRKLGAPRQGAIGVRCVFSRESVRPPADAACSVDGSLNCHGYGSSVTVTATFGMVAAAELIRLVLARR